MGGYYNYSIIKIATITWTIVLCSHPNNVNSFSIHPKGSNKYYYNTPTRLVRNTQQSSSSLSSSSSSVLSSRYYNDNPAVKIKTSHNNPSVVMYSSFASDGSEYSADNSDFDSEDDIDSGVKNNIYNPMGTDDETPTIELQPVPMSKNSGNRFVAFIWDRLLANNDKENNKDVLDLHYDRIALTEDHVMYCRKTSLYNDTFNTDSMVDVMWSLPILSSDLRRVIGHAMCLESTELKYVQEFLRNEPIIQMLTGGDITNIPLYRWRHIRDYTLRIDDGRFGYPCLCLGIDANAETDNDVGNIRNDYEQQQLEYLIRSERIIAVGPLHLPTIVKDDPSSYAVGDLMLFNAKDRTDAINFVEQLPYAQEGLYDTMKVHFYNQLDVTGKFVSEDPLRDAPCTQMKEAMEIWGYPVQDDQTAWLNC